MLLLEELVYAKHEYMLNIYKTLLSSTYAAKSRAKMVIKRVDMFITPPSIHPYVVYAQTF